MCGILGFFSSDNNKKQMFLEEMNALITHRGPDQSGYYTSQSLNFAHQRLSIHDLTEAGAQPMFSHCGNFVIVFNGEIYNFDSIRQKLEAVKSIHWRGRSDTEVLLEAYVEFGLEKTLALLDGMFAFAIHDRASDTVIFARDRFGEKPLYFYFGGNEFAFSSELRPIELFTNSLTLNHSAVSTQLQYSYIPDDHSIYNEVVKLLPGHYLTISISSDGSYVSSNQRQYWSAVDAALMYKASSMNLPPADAQLLIEEALEQSVVERMASDVPLGAFLSGGIDSTCIVALMQKNSSKKINTFSIGFNDKNYNEAHHAKAVAGILGTEHHELYLEPKDIIDLVPRLHLMYDEPFSDSSQLPTFMVSQFAKTKVTVALTGDSGDELFGGYNRHILAEKLSKVLENVPFSLRRGVSKLLQSPSPEHYESVAHFVKTITAGRLQISSLGDKAYKFSRAFGSKNGTDLYSKLINTAGSNLCIAQPLDTIRDDIFSHPNLSLSECMMLQDIIGYMRNDILTKVDRASMACSLETRVPFLSNKVFEAAWRAPISAKINRGVGKLPLRNIISKYVPDELMNRPKAGFGVPIYHWLRHDLREWAENLLSEHALEKSGLLDTNAIRKSWALHLSGKCNLQYEIWNVLMFQQWYMSK
jgi:asparagine synthase (glutamine-hydrolysing)